MRLNQPKMYVWCCDVHLLKLHNGQPHPQPLGSPKANVPSPYTMTWAGGHKLCSYSSRTLRTLRALKKPKYAGAQDVKQFAIENRTREKEIKESW